MCILFLFVIILDSRNAYTEGIDLTDQIQYVGNPYLERYPAESQIYARNIWDMISYDGRVYFGAGNSSNSGPASNAGPLPIISFDPNTNSFLNVFNVNEEQVDIFYIFNGKLFVPGHDPREGWSFGNIYTFESGKQWEKHRNIPNAIHIYALAMHQGRLFAALGTNKNKSIAISEDQGETWQPQSTTMSSFFNFLIVEDKLYAASKFFTGAHLNGEPVKLASPIESVLEFEENAIFKPRIDLSNPLIIFPDSSFDNVVWAKIFKSTTFKGKCLYIGAKIHNDLQAIPFGAYVSSSFEKGNVKIDKILLPDHSMAYDILVRNNTLYLLSNKREESSTEVSVWQSIDGMEWSKLFYFSSPNFVRSFERLGDKYFFSLGSEISDNNSHKSSLPGNTGDILQLIYPPISSSVTRKYDAN